MDRRRDLCRDDSVPLGIHQEHSGSSVEFLELLGDSHLFGTLGPAVFGRVQEGNPARPSAIAHADRPRSARLAFGKWLKILSG